MCSKVQFHAKPQRNLSRITLNEELFVAWQGPPVTESRKLLEKSLDLRFGARNDWHFVRSTRKERLVKWTRSQVLDRTYRELKDEVKLPFML